MGWSQDSGEGSTYTHPATHPATMITIADAGNNFTATEVEAALAELFQSVSNGKTSLKTAITGKGGSVSQAGAYPTFTELETGITGIPTGGKKANGTVTSDVFGDFKDTSGGTQNLYPLIVNGLTFKPSVIIAFKSTDASNQAAFSSQKIMSGYTITTVSVGQSVAYNLRTTTSPGGADVSSGSVRSDGFVIPVGSSSTSYKWYAFE